MNGFIGALAAQLALKPVSPAADGIAPRPRPSGPRARAVITLRRVASQQPMAPALQVGRASMRRRTQRMARADAPPVLQVGGAHQCPSRAPPQ